MKKFFLFFAFLGLVTFTSQAQDAPACNKAKTACTKAKSASCAKTCTKTAAAKLASTDASIQQKVCEKSGNVSYYKSSVCAVSGKTSTAQVEYCSKSQKFVNVSPKGAAEKATCTKKAAATKVSDSSKKKACCAGKSKASCSKAKAKNASEVKAAAKDSNVKLIKNEQEQ